MLSSWELFNGNDFQPVRHHRVNLYVHFNGISIVWSIVLFWHILFNLVYFYRLNRVCFFVFCQKERGKHIMAKQKIEIIASEETYMNLQPFQDIQQLNDAVRAHKAHFDDQLSKTALSVLELLQRYAAKFTGVCFLTKNHIAGKLEISRRTVIRVCQQLEEMGIIRQYEMKRKSDMRQTSNAIVIQPVEEKKEELVTQEDPNLSHQKNNISLKQNNNINHLNNKKRNPYIKFVPKSLQHYQAIFGKNVKALYGRVWLAAKTLDIKVEQELMQQIGLIAMDYIKSLKSLPLDQQCKIAYKIALNQLEQRFGKGGDCLDWNYEAERLFKSVAIQ
jgi:DNA-binding Lrp family transcriptional regulator